MTVEAIERPGATVQARTLAELLGFDETSEVAVEWGRQLRDIERCERSAEDEEASVRIR